MPQSVRCLSFHATYRCRHSGDCCAAGWPIPIEADRLARLRVAVANGTLHAAGSHTQPFVTTDAAPADTPALLGVDEHRCVFYDLDRRDGRCRIHAALGHEALPLACRQFPRVSVRDPRGVSITLSHYCPTALLLLDDPRPVTIVTNPPAFPAGGEYVGLDATTSLPPLLRANLLMDWDSWWRFEALAVESIAGETAPAPPSDGLARLHAVVEHVRTWRPGEGALNTVVAGAFERTSAGLDTSQWHARFAEEKTLLVNEALDAIPADLRGSVPQRDGTITPARRERNFLAAHAFANWSAHTGRDLRAWFRSLETAWALLQAGYSVRQADLVLRHLSDYSAPMNGYG